MTSLKQNDQVYLARMARIGTSDMHFTIGTVVKVTPAGAVDVQIAGSAGPMRFRPDGKRQGGNGYHDYCLDEIPFAERAASLARRDRQRAAAAAISKIHGVQAADRWDKASLAREVARLRAELEAAASLVEAI